MPDRVPDLPDRVPDQPERVPDQSPNVVQSQAAELDLGIQILIRYEVIAHLPPHARETLKVRVIDYAQSVADEWPDPAKHCLICKNPPARRRGDEVLCPDCESFYGYPE